MPCPHGHRAAKVPDSLLGPESYYYPTCDKLYEMALREVDTSIMPEGRFEDIKGLAMIIDLRTKVTKADLIKLGYWKP
jgi:hypothetical protein